LVCLTNLATKYPPMPPKLNRRRAEAVLRRIDSILAWEAQHDNERDTRFVEVGKCLCDVRAGQYWRLENLKSFDEFLERRFRDRRPGCRGILEQLWQKNVTPVLPVDSWAREESVAGLIE
jgi:hypothetical protein